MTRRLSNYLLSDFVSGKTLDESISEVKVQEMKDVLSKGEGEVLVFSMMTLLSLYIEEPYKRPIRLVKSKINKETREVVSTDTFNLSRKDYIDCKAFLYKTELGIDTLYLQEDSSDVKMKTFISRIVMELKSFIEAGLGKDYSVNLTMEI